MINSADEISRMTLAGNTTAIKVNNLEEAKHMLLLCKLKINLFRCTFCLTNILNFDKYYSELMNIYLKIMEIENLKVCFATLITYFTNH